MKEYLLVRSLKDSSNVNTYDHFDTLLEVTSTNKTVHLDNGKTNEVLYITFKKPVCRWYRKNIDSKYLFCICLSDGKYVDLEEQVEAIINKDFKFCSRDREAILKFNSDEEAQLFYELKFE